MGYFPYNVVLKPEEMKRHLDAATEISKVILRAGEQASTKPYDIALAMYLAMCGLCKQHGWDPRDFHQWVAGQFPEKVIPTLIG